MFNIYQQVVLKKMNLDEVLQGKFFIVYKDCW